MRRYARKCKHDKRIVDAKSRTRVVRTIPSYKVYDLRSRRRKRRIDDTVLSTASYRAETKTTVKDANDNQRACLSSSLHVPTSLSSSCLLSNNNNVVTASLCSKDDLLNKCDSTISAITPHHPQVESYGEASTKFIVDDNNKPLSFNSPSSHVISMASVSANVQNSGAFEPIKLEQSDINGSVEIKQIMRLPSEYEIEEFFSTAEKQLHEQFSDKYNFDVVKDIPLEGRYEWVQIKP